MRGKALTFFLRLISTVGLWAVLLAAILTGYEFLFFVLIAGVALTGLWEYFNMIEAAGNTCFRLTGMLSTAVFFVGSFLYLRAYGTSAGHDFELAVLVAFILVVFGRQMFSSMKESDPVRTIVYTLFGLIYVPWLFNFLTKIVYLTPRVGTEDMVTGQYYVLYLIMVTKFADMGAYVFGMLFGRHLSVPHISPQKTWEGFAGALFTALLASWLIHFLFPDKLSLLGTWDLIILPLLLGVGAIIGDLAESIIKRGTGTKDSSQLLPGIGGTLDLIDSLLFTAPILYFYLRLVLGVGL